MAALSEPTRLIAGELDPKCLYLESQASSKGLIITTGGRHVSVYDVNDTQPVNTWTAMSGLTLSSGAVYDTKGDRYAAVVDNKVIRLWNKNDVAINKGKKITMSKPVKRLISNGQLEPLIVYSDGSLAWLSSSTEHISPPHLQGDEQLNWVEGIVTNNQLVLMMIITKKGKVQPKSLVYNIKEESQAVPGRQLDLSEDASSNQCKCLREKDGQATFLSLDAAGQLTETFITGPSTGQTVKHHNITLHGSSHAIASIGSTNLVVAGVQSPTTEKACIGLWDTRFGILTAHKPLPSASSGAGQMQVHRYGNQVILVCTKGLYLYPFVSKQSTLGAALGKFSTSKDSIQKTDDSTVELLKRLANPELVKTQKQFSDTFNTLIQTGKFNRLAMQNLGTAVLKRCITENKFWPKDELKVLIQRNMIPSSMITEVVEALVAHNELKLIHLCLVTLPDIPETAVRTALTHSLRTENSQFDGNVSSKEKKNSRNFGPAKARFIRTILALPFNEAFMAGEVRKMDFENCLQLLEFLHFMLESNSKGAVSLVKVVDWLNLVLDAHFTQMILATEVHPVLIKLHDVVEKQVQFYNGLVGLQSILAQIKEKCSLPRKQFPGLYNIHVLHVY